MPIRSFLFAPANHPRRVEKSFTVGDAVGRAEKPAARAKAVEALQGPRRCRGYVRVNASETAFCYGDVLAVVQPGLDGIVLPKVEAAAGLLTIDWLIGQLERERGLPVGGIDLLPIIETAYASGRSTRSWAPGAGPGASPSGPGITASISV
jgi:citrate lyase subunit beta/citryl-CoA lyase